MRAFMMPGRKRSALLPDAPILAALIMQAHHTKRHTMRLSAKTIRKASFFAIVAKKSSFVLISPAVLSSFASLRIARAFCSRTRFSPPFPSRTPFPLLPRIFGALFLCEGTGWDNLQRFILPANPLAFAGAFGVARFCSAPRAPLARPRGFALSASALGIHCVASAPAPRH